MLKLKIGPDSARGAYSTRWPCASAISLRDELCEFFRADFRQTSETTQQHRQPKFGIEDRGLNHHIGHVQPVVVHPIVFRRSFRVHAFAILALLAGLGPLDAQDRTLLFSASDPGVPKPIPTWGLDTAWLNADNVHRGVLFMGQPQVDVIRFSFTGDWPLTNGDLGASALAEFNDRMNIVNSYTDSHTALYLNNDSPTCDSSFIGGDGRIEPVAWAGLINVTRQRCMNAGRTVLAVSPYNEPDNSFEQGSVTRLGDVSWQLRNIYGANFSGIKIYGASTLNNDNANIWYNTLNGWGYLEAGSTHQLAGSFDNYAAFYQNVQANSDLAGR